MSSILGGHTWKLGCSFLRLETKLGLHLRNPTAGRKHNWPGVQSLSRFLLGPHSDPTEAKGKGGGKRGSAGRWAEGGEQRSHQVLLLWVTDPADPKAGAARAEGAACVGWGRGGATES